jgi:hypothetical protein
MDSLIIFSQEVPPRSLIHLAKEYYGDDYISLSCSFFWKATSSWALSSFPDHSYPLLPRCVLPNSHVRLSSLNTDRAKLASGMAHLIRYVENTQSIPKGYNNKYTTERMSWPLSLPSRLKSIVKYMIRRWSTTRKNRPQRDKLVNP